MKYRFISGGEANYESNKDQKINVWDGIYSLWGHNRQIIILFDFS